MTKRFVFRHHKNTNRSIENSCKHISILIAIFLAVIFFSLFSWQQNFIKIGRPKFHSHQYAGACQYLGGIKEAIRDASGKNPWIECNVDPWGNNQLFQIYQYVDTSVLTIIECPVLSRGLGCTSKIEFPSF